MLADRLSRLARREPIAFAALAIALGGAAAILGAWFFQYVVGLAPCPLCLEQRVAYYVAIPLAALVALGASYGATRKVLLLALFVIAAFMLWNAGLGVYHAGIEWKWWVGPETCSAAPSFDSLENLLERINRMRIVRCDEAPWRFLGLSLAGYNALISLALAALALWAALKRPYGSSSLSQ